MGLQLSITYIQSSFSTEALYEAAISAFKSELGSNLFCLDYTNFTTYKKCGPLTTERFLGPTRAAFITESILSDCNCGVVIYPKRNGLFTIVDSLIHEIDIFQANRTRLPELYTMLQEQPKAIEYTNLPAYMNFLIEHSRTLRAEMVHMMHVTNPAGFATAIHFYDSGQYIDNYYTEDIQSDPNLTEMPRKPNEIRRILNGRFSFLLRQPRVRVYDDGTSAEIYFSVERHFPEKRKNRYQLGDKPDLFKIRRSRLYVPTWDNNPHPFGVVYCPGNDLPEWLYEKHGMK